MTRKLLSFLSASSAREPVIGWRFNRYICSCVIEYHFVADHAFPFPQISSQDVLIAFGMSSGLMTPDPFGLSSWNSPKKISASRLPSARGLQAL